MKNNERENDVFDELLRDALASDAAPSEDFTARLMEQVRRTPQEKPLRKQPVIKLLAAVAACAVIVVTIPLLMPRGGSAFDQMTSDDCAAPMANEAPDTDEEPRSSESGNAYFTGEPADGNSVSGTAQDNNSENWKQMNAENTDQSLTLVGQDAKDAKAALDDMDIQPTKTETDRYIYVLTEQQAQELGQTVDALYGVEGSLTLTLEVTE